MIESVSQGNVIARFSGTPVEGEAPARFGVEALSFEFEDGSTIRFVPSGTLGFSDWDFEVFSPDGRWTLLPQDRFGPYHVVATARLEAYLRGDAEPDHALGWREGEAAAVHSGAAWDGPASGTFHAACCGERQTVSFDLTGEQPSLALAEPASETDDPGGRYVVSATRPAGDTPSTLSVQQRAGEWLGEEATFGETLDFAREPVCTDWSIAYSDEAPPRDPVVQEFLPRDGSGRWAELGCGEALVDEIFVVGASRYLSRTPNGAIWLIWDRVSEEREAP